MSTEMPAAARLLESPAVCLVESGVPTSGHARGLRHALLERFRAGDRSVSGVITGLSLDPETTEEVCERLTLIGCRSESSGGLRLWLSIPRRLASELIDAELTAPVPSAEGVQERGRQELDLGVDLDTQALRLRQAADALAEAGEVAAVAAVERIVPVDEFCRIAPAVHLRAARIAQHSIASLVEAIRSGHERRHLAQGIRELAMLRQAAWRR